jgi:hypothetical protein
MIDRPWGFLQGSGFYFGVVNAPISILYMLDVQNTVWQGAYGTNLPIWGVGVANFRTVRKDNAISCKMIRLWHNTFHGVEIGHRFHTFQTMPVGNYHECKTLYRGASLWHLSGI